MLAELHCHTTHSRGTKILYEGLNTTEQMVRHAKKIGMGAIAITDHNTTNGCHGLKRLSKKYGIVVIPGEEISTKAGHVLALGIEEEIPPRLSLDETLYRIKKQGGISVAAHPFDIRRKGAGTLAIKCDALEVFNSINLERITNWKCHRFAKKYNKPVTAGSDAHCISMLGHGVTSIQADNDIDSILKAIKNGKTNTIEIYTPSKIIMEWSIKRLKLSYAYVIRYMNRNYSWPKRAVGEKLLGLAEKSPGNIDYLFRVIAYLSLGSAMVYSAVRTVLGVK
ncbi:MAG: PHP domain-containing protein [Candidatus Aenigmarchaeota archaeon]|nr:PHP domain-containing protein [Candidatus Aenigmarchaeota archaeon]